MSFEIPELSQRSWRSSLEQTARAGREELSQAIRRSCDGLLVQQALEGFWCGELTADTTLESDYILLQLWLHQPDGAAWNPPGRTRINKAVGSILERQLPDGGFNIYVGGPSDISATVKAYCALKLAGVGAETDPMRRMRARILALGGLQAANSYVKINLSLFGLYPRKYVPTIPPEITLLPGGVLYEMSSWTRSILVPLSIVQARGSNRRAPQGFNLDELLRPGVSLSIPRRKGISLIFHHLDRAFKVWEKRGPERVRGAAIRQAEKWVLDRTRHTEGLGAIYPAMMYFIMALDALNYPLDHPDRIEAIRHFESLLVETESRFMFQPCVSPIWDTAICAFALGEAGVSSDPRMTAAADWLISKEVRRKGDWSVKRPDTEPSGWAFEFANEFYPDIDDTAMVLLALMHAKGSNADAQSAAERRAVNWLLAMQSEDGGWAAFDVDNNWAMLNEVPFADHNAMLDPTCPDITGRVVECLCRRGMAGHEAVTRGVRYLLKSQEKDGSWYGRWGVNYIYGSFLAMRGLVASRSTDAVDAVSKAARWLRAIQNPDGGWGESCASYERDHFVSAASCPSQTAWAVLGLLAAGDRDSVQVRRGIQFLLERQRPDGTWPEDATTGTGFPNVFYLSYGMYRDYFPLLALATSVGEITH
ncbi:MAG TPA: squalene--hopene cyclase [Candidatus Sulfopaludibacter sp.]|jgi:squalene-hopene/tetraprenyl-beta-curcumene cyclase|nr:squalene--hopene cyclase [Candidatus Sulfopaludibacter sp.]